MAHFNKMQTPLKAVERYPTTTAQEIRFKGLGWSRASARNLWQLWNDSKFVTPQERMALDTFEPFDEWEEFALFGCHYFLLVADTTATTQNCDSSKEALLDVDNISAHGGPFPFVELEIAYSDNPKAHGRRRFAAVLPLRPSTRAQERIGIFGGMGLSSRINTVDVYARDFAAYSPSTLQANSVVPSSRIGHTITDLGDTGALLVGGRTSPDKALTDCWLYHKWLDTWERVEDLPRSLYRHGAAAVGNGHVLISPGKSDSRSINTMFYIWSRALGWIECIQGPGEKPRPSYGATFIVFEKSTDPLLSKRGLLAGGMSEDSSLVEEVWEWELRNFSSQVSKHYELAAVKIR